MAHGFIPLKGCVKYIHDSDTTLIFNLKVKLIGFMTWLCGQASCFLSFDIVILCLARECITMVRCVAYIHEFCMTLTFDLNIKIIFYHGFESGKMFLLFDIGIPNFGKWVCHHQKQHVVYILDLSMTLTFDLYVGGAVIRSEFYSQVLSC